MFLPQEDVSDVAKASVVHLRLLFAFRKLRLEIGSRRDLWGINDDRLDDQLQALSGEERQQGQAKIREKRWSIYLAKAVHRYEVWWKTMRPKPLTQSETESTESARYATFPQQSIPAQFTEENLMPLDVLMVWHTHMLNPRLYLEDTMRQGRGDIWSSGLPWNLLSRCITHDDFTYNVGDASKLNWESATGLSWDNTNDPPHIEVACPACESPMKFAWTTCNLIEPEDSVLEATLVGSDNEDEADRAETATIIDNGSSSLQLRLNLIGNGLADGKISQRCYSCRTEVDQDLLCFHKFMRDAKSLGDGSNSGHCMPATLLDPRTGMPELNMSVDSIHKKNAALTAPNRLVYGIVRTLELELNKYRHQGGTRPTMEGLRDRIHRNLHLAMNLVEMAGEKEPYSRAARLAERVQKEVDTGSSYRKARVVLRSMLAQYADNWSPFALDLRAAMLRQSLFIDNMYKFDWLHGPDPQATTARAVNKYIRFIELARMNPGRMVVPTLDVDLAWHTHQLSPKAYYRATTLYISNFLDHDDKVDEDKLSVSFDWMSEAYYQKYKEIYSECLCWYCQATFAGQSNSISSLLGSSTRQKSLKNLHNQQASGDKTSDFGPHLSAHNAVEVKYLNKHYDPTRRLYDKHVQRRKAGAKRAETLAKKHNDASSAIQQYVDHWGYPYPLPGPWVCPRFFDQVMYGSSISNPSPASGINADINVGGCVTGCGALSNCGAATVKLIAEGRGGPRSGAIHLDVYRVPRNGGGGATGGGGGCGGGGGGCGGG